jgi:site-specific DNA-methyltransferase (adenine-specific)
MAYEIHNADCFEWMAQQPSDSVHAVITDPPYGVKEYTRKELDKLKAGRGGVWRIPPSIGGSQRAPLPRFTVLSDEEVRDLYVFFFNWARLVQHVLAPGGHVFIAANPLLSDVVFNALREAGLEKRGEIVRCVRTLRGGDRPKGAEDEFPDVCAMPRSCYEPWGLFRRPFEGTLADNLRRWGTGGLRRASDETPFCDVIESVRTPQRERDIAPHPSLKPQQFMRQLVWAALPLGKGVILDPFVGGGATLAAAEALGYDSIGVEINPEYAEMARQAVPRLAMLKVEWVQPRENLVLESPRDSERYVQPCAHSFPPSGKAC